MEILEEVPEEYRERPEEWFRKIDKEKALDEIKHLEAQVKSLKEQNREYQFALYEIASIFRIWKTFRHGRCYKIQVDEAKKVLSRFPEETKEVSLELDKT